MTALTPELIVNECCKMFSIPEDEIKTKDRYTKNVICRAFISYFLKKCSNLSLNQIGVYIGRDHSNVVHLLRTIDVYKTMHKTYHDNFYALMENFIGKKPINICPTCGHVSL